MITCLILFSILNSYADNINIGDKAPSFALYDLNSKILFLTEILKTAPVVINFWNLNCVPCKEELPGIVKLAIKYKGKATFIIINNDDRKKAPDSQKIKEIYKEDITAVVSLFDFFKVVSKQYNLQEESGNLTVPQTFIVDKNQEIRYFKKGKLSEKDLINLERILDDIISR